MAKVTKANPIKAIENFCMECICGEKEMITNCTGYKCPLFALRPFQSTTKTVKGKTVLVAPVIKKKTMSVEQKAKMKAGKIAKRAERVAAGLPTSTRVKKVKVIKNAGKADASRARMTDSQKLKMKLGRERAKAAKMSI